MKKKKGLHIGLDLDGVVYDLVEEMLPLLSRAAGRDVLKEDIVEFNIPHALGLSISNADLFQRVADEGLYWKALKPLTMAKSAIRELIKKDHKITIVTSRPRRVPRPGGVGEINLEIETREWVRKHFPNEVAVEVRGENFENPTEKVTLDDDFDLFVDDDPGALARVIRLQELDHVKTHPVAFDQPWNQSWAGDRVFDWRGLVEFARQKSDDKGEKIGRFWHGLRRRGKKVDVYLASPLGFTESTRGYLKDIVDLLEGDGHKVFNPWDRPEGRLILEAEALPDKDERLRKLVEANRLVAKANEDGIRSCDWVLAILDGVDVDSGTASEIGFAYALKKQIWGLRSDFRSTGDNDASIVNLQVQYWIEASGGRICRSLPELREALDSGVLGRRKGAAVRRL